MAVAESRRRRKRQVSNSYSEFGARTSSSSPTSRRQQPQYFDQIENPPFTAFNQHANLYDPEVSQYQSPNPKRSTSLEKDTYANYDSSYFSSSTGNPTTSNKKSSSRSTSPGDGKDLVDKARSRPGGLLNAGLKLIAGFLGGSSGAG